MTRQIFSKIRHLFAKLAHSAIQEGTAEWIHRMMMFTCQRRYIMTQPQLWHFELGQAVSDFRQ